MAFYEIRWKDSAKKDLKRISRDEIPRILKAVEDLSENPLPVGAKKDDLGGVDLPNSNGLIQNCL